MRESAEVPPLEAVEVGSAGAGAGGAGACTMTSLTARALVAAVLAAATILGACGPSAPAPGVPGGAAPGAPAVAAPAPQATFDPDAAPAFQVIQSGTGPQVRDGDVVLLHYVGTLTSNGLLFDDTHRVGTPFAFTVGRGNVIRGLDLLAPKLHVGDKVKTTIPWQLAYGEQGILNGMPPKADLDYVIDVIGIVPPPSWEVIVKGEGREAKAGTKVTVHYICTLPDGKVVEDSRARNEPYVFRVGVGEAIEGWDFVVSRMRQGDRWKVQIPWVYAYGADGVPPTIPPTTDLSYDIEVLGVE